MSAWGVGYVRMDVAAAPGLVEWTDLVPYEIDTTPDPFGVFAPQITWGHTSGSSEAFLVSYIGNTNWSAGGGTERLYCRKVTVTGGSITSLSSALTISGTDDAQSIFAVTRLGDGHFQVVWTKSGGHLMVSLVRADASDTTPVLIGTANLSSPSAFVYGSRSHHRAGVVSVDETTELRSVFIHASNPFGGSGADQRVFAMPVGNSGGTPYLAGSTFDVAADTGANYHDPMICGVGPGENTEPPYLVAAYEQGTALLFRGLTFDSATATISAVPSNPSLHANAGMSDMAPAGPGQAVVAYRYVLGSLYAIDVVFVAVDASGVSVSLHYNVAQIDSLGTAADTFHFPAVASDGDGTSVIAWEHDWDNGTDYSRAVRLGVVPSAAMPDAVTTDDLVATKVNGFRGLIALDIACAPSGVGVAAFTEDLFSFDADDETFRGWMHPFQIT